MRFILDMVHHNPGEGRFESAFLNPQHLKAYGYNGQVFKHINCVATFQATGADLFPNGSAARRWLDGFLPGIETEIRAAKSAGLAVFYHLDLFVLPRALVELYRDEICDPVTGCISLERPRTLELHRVLFDELCARFPDVDGYIVRVGETYLFDTPFHTGNSPIPKVGSGWTPTYGYEEVLRGSAARVVWTQAQADAYVRLLRFLREELCVKHGKHVIFRTWDIFPDKLHAVPEHYLEVTDRVEPHPQLLFSIKHTALDFWRRVKVNECLARGRHAQVVEVQCAREYEGKGAYPNYVMEGIFKGFEENAERVGLKDILKHPLIRGVYGWSRGGGWYGPYLKHEFWCDLQAYVLGRVAADPARTEAAVFHEYCLERMQLSPKDAAKFREFCRLSARAVLKGRYCEAFDLTLHEALLPTALWMRDDRLGGLDQLADVLGYLARHQLLEQALAEKAESARLWERMAELLRQITIPDQRLRETLEVSVEYGRLLFQIVLEGWRVLAAQVNGERTGQYDRAELGASIERYDALWREYRALSASPECASLYEGVYFNLPGSPPVSGLRDSVEQCRALLLQEAGRR